MKRRTVALLVFVAGCGSGDDDGVAAAGGGDASSDASVTADAIGSEASPDASEASLRESSAPDSSAPDSSDGLPPGCADAEVPPSTLECTGLYSDFSTKTLSAHAQPYAPAVPLWSDGAVKERWIELPPGAQIDVSDPNEWVFPIGTKLFKQFTYEGKRVETRLFQKTATNFWVHATYGWNADETAAPISYGGSVPVDSDGGTWVIPTPDQCDSCHQGRHDRILGFEQVSLGLPGATGLTLLQLVVQGLVTPAPTQVNLRIGDDGTGLDAPALSWLHINCGVTCHNSNESAAAYGAHMRLRLDPTLLDGSRPTSSWDPLQTTIGVPCISSPSVAGIPRILPGDPSGSAIVQLTSQRGLLQMPPIATRIVDTADIANVVAWISALAPADAGIADSGSDAGPLPPDAGASDANLSDAVGQGGPETGTPVDAAVPPDANEGNSDAGDAGAPPVQDAGGDADATVSNGGPDSSVPDDGTPGQGTADAESLPDQNSTAPDAPGPSADGSSQEAASPSNGDDSSPSESNDGSPSGDDASASSDASSE